MQIKNEVENPRIIVLQTDFGLRDGTVNELEGVICTVDKSLRISHLTHEISPYNIFEAAYRLYQVAPYWPSGTVFVSVVDPGVGTKRKSIVLKSKTNHFFVSPDNGTLTLIHQQLGSEEILEIDENKYFLPTKISETSYGRDLYVHIGAKLASGQEQFKDMGKPLSTELVKIPQSPPYINKDTLFGTLQSHDGYGNVWTNIDLALIDGYDLVEGAKFQVKIFSEIMEIYSNVIPFCRTYGDVPKGDELLYLNSVSCLAIGINQCNFAKRYHVMDDDSWRIQINKQP